MVPYQAFATAVTTVSLLTAFHHGRSPWSAPRSREHPYGDDRPFPVQEATVEVPEPLHPALFVAQYSMPVGSGRGIHKGGARFNPGSDHVSMNGIGGDTDTRMARIRLTFQAFARV